jgi:hypothetical protein
MPTLVRVTSSKVFTLLGIPTWGVEYPPHVMTKLMKDENFIGLIWATKVYYAIGLRDVCSKVYYAIGLKDVCGKVYYAIGLKDV